jgi:hypothetical protein
MTEAAGVRPRQIRSINRSDISRQSNSVFHPLTEAIRLLRGLTRSFG